MKIWHTTYELPGTKTSVLVCIPIGLIKHRPKTTWEGKSSYTTWVINCHGRKLRQELKAGTQRQEVKQRPWRKAAYLLVCFQAHIQLPAYPATYLPRGGFTHSEIDLPPWIATEEKNAHRHRDGVVWCRQLLSLSSLFLSFSVCVKLTKTNSTPSDFSP